MKIEVSTGEILDKFSILIIKRSNIMDDAKLDNIQKEIDELLPMFISITCKDKKVYDKYIDLAIVNNIKKEINLLTNSGIVEEKSYESY